MPKLILIALLSTIFCSSCTEITSETTSNPSITRNYELSVYDDSSPVAEFAMYAGGKGESRNQILEQFFHERRLVRRFVDNDTLWGFIDIDSSLVIDCIYDYASTFEYGFALVKKDGLKGIINKSGKEVLSPQYDYLIARYQTPEEKEMLFMYRQDSSWGFASLEKGELCRLKVDSLFNFKYGFATAKMDNKMALVRYDGKQLTAFKYDWISSFNEGVAGVQLNDKSGFINEEGEEIIPLIYDNYQGFFEGVGCVKKGSKWGVIDTGNNIILPFKYDEVYDLWEDGNFTIKNKNTEKCVTLAQLYNGKAQKILAMPYDKIDFFKNDRALVTKAQKIGAIDTNGRIIIPLKYTKLSPMYRLSTYYLAAQNNKQGIIDTANNIIFPFVYKYISPEHTPNAISLKLLKVENESKKTGIVDLANNIVIPLEYDYVGITAAGNGFWVWKNGLNGMLSLDGTKTLVPLKYFKIEVDKEDPTLVYAYKDSLEQESTTIYLAK